MDLQIATNHEKNILDFNIMYFIFHIWANQSEIFLTFIKAGIIETCQICAFDMSAGDIKRN
jgi:hypothetical protein